MSIDSRIKDISRTIEERYQKNLEFFKNNMSSIYKLIEENPKKLSLTFNEQENRLEKINGDGSLYYSNGALNFAAYEIANFEKKMGVSDYRPLPWTINPQHLIKKKAFTNTIMNYAKFYSKNIKPDVAHSGVVILGIGMGYHIEILCNRDKFHHLTIIETDIEKFIESLYCVDWKGILTNLKPNKKLTFMIKNPKMSMPDFCSQIQYQCYFLFPSIQVSTLIFSHDHKRNKDNFNDIRETIKEFNNITKAATERSGPDCQRLLNTNENFRNRFSLINLDKTKIIDESIKIAIIGAGPSLDDYIDILKKYKDKILIISSGSSLTSLLKNDIKPDIHFELEFQNLATKLLKHTNTEYDLSQIDLICSAESNPGFLSLFGNARMFIQETSEINKLMKEEYILKFGGLTCTNGAAAIISRVCNNDIMFFGLDYANTHGQHHAIDNITNKNNLPDSLNYIKTAGEQLKKPGEVTVTSIHGETLLTTPPLFSARILMEALIQSNKNTYYNCSNGAKIKGTEHLSREQLSEEMEKSKDGKKVIHYKEILMPTDHTINYTREVFNTSFNVSEKIIEEIQSLKGMSKVTICIKICEIISNIIKHFNHGTGQFRNIMGFNRTPLLLLYSTINYSPEEDSGIIIDSWLEEQKENINYSAKTIQKKFDENNFFEENDWLERNQ